MCRRKGCVTLEKVVNDCLPLWHLALTEFGQASGLSVTTFDYRAGGFGAKFLMRRKTNAAVMATATKITIELTDLCRVQSIKCGCMSPKITLLDVRLKHASTSGDDTSAKSGMPEMRMQDSRPNIH